MASSVCGGAIGAGVPCPVHPKSEMHLNATANPALTGQLQSSAIAPYQQCQHESPASRVCTFLLTLTVRPVDSTQLTHLD
jgi:hypothetical protein